MSNPNFQAKLGSTGATALIADSSPSPVADTNGRSGWSWTKDAVGSQKFNYYFYAGTYENMKIKDLSSVYFLGSIDKWTDTTNEAPFFVIYTKMTGSGDAGAWYHSRHAFSLHKDSQLVRTGEKCLFYCLGNPRDEFDGARKIPFNTRIDTGAWDTNNEVLYMTLQSDSGADMGASVYTEMLGVDMFGFGSRIADSHINMNLLS